VIDVPDLVADGTLQCVVSMSGGKDSTACALALREAGVPFSMVFSDTGWEAPETYEQIDYLREAIGPIDVVGIEGGMVWLIRKYAAFPHAASGWCTRELKIEPLRAHHDALETATGIETACVVGIRAEESERRAKMLAWEDEPVGARSWGGWVWRPIISWAVEDVIAIHHRHGVRVHPHYTLGFDRVGCYPCKHANKEQIRLLAERDPERVDLIRDLEAEVTAERARRRAAGSKHTSDGATFFLRPIDEVVAWSQTSRGGRQLPLIPLAPSGGCFRWGMCEPPSAGSR